MYSVVRNLSCTHVCDAGMYNVHCTPQMCNEHGQTRYSVPCYNILDNVINIFFIKCCLILF
jgi:hypothetical protein